MSAFLSGFLVSLLLISAIGAQNAFVLRQGLKRQHVFIVCLICALSDAILIVAGVAGFATILSQLPWLEQTARYAGAAFLIAYGIKSVWSAFNSTDYLEPATETAKSLSTTVLSCLAFTWLNPHVYLDTVIFLGSISTQFEGHEFRFAAGAAFASFVFFFSLGFGARFLTPLFRNPLSWKVLDFAVALLMFFLAFAFLVYD